MERALVPDRLPELLRAVHGALVGHRDEIDALNVFPVPDGDTGTNLEATARAVVEALPRDGTVDGAVLVRAALRAARGNSGVIFSQVVRAVVEAVQPPVAGQDDRRTDVAVLADALSSADDLARQAVAEPVEGTILTALTVAAETAADALVDQQDDLVLVLAQVLEDVSEAVLATREQLDVLREAGVVDAGARGLEVVIAAIQSVLTGQATEVADLGPVIPRCVDTAADDVEANPYEVQYVLDGGAEVAADLRTRLSALGDSVVVVEADGLVSAHVHTPDPDAAVATAEALGEPSGVRITDLRDGVPDPVGVPIVVVVPDGGLADLARASGAAVVPGAAGALPSVDDLLRAARSCPGDRVAVLPGHPNVVPTARQAARVIAQDGPRIDVVAEAVHPLVVLSCLAVGSTQAADLQAAATRCTAGEVVAAVRDASTPAGSVATDQPMVVVDGDVIAVADGVSQALATLLEALGAATADLVTVAVGADCDLDPGAVMALVSDHAGDAEVEVLDAGQRPALLLVAVES